MPVDTWESIESHALLTTVFQHSDADLQGGLPSQVGTFKAARLSILLCFSLEPGEEGSALIITLPVNT